MNEADVEAAATLLSIGFPNRARAEWLAGLRRQGRRHVPEGFPRFGLVLEADGRLVGIVLTIFAEVEADGRRFVRCHFSSWYVDEHFKAWSPLLINQLLRDRNVTFVNISPASHTSEIIEAQGFRSFSNGWVLTVPWLTVGRERVRVRRFESAAATATDLGECRLLAEHQAFGCICLLLEARDGWHPFVFTARRRVGKLPAASYLIYCRDLGEYARFAGALGRALLRNGILAVIADREVSDYKIAGRPISRTQDKYFRGPDRPRAGDNSFSELAIFSR